MLPHQAQQHTLQVRWTAEYDCLRVALVSERVFEFFNHEQDNLSKITNWEWTAQCLPVAHEAIALCPVQRSCAFADICRHGARCHKVSGH